MYTVPSVQPPQGTLRGPAQYATQHKKSLIEEALGYFVAVVLVDGPGDQGTPKVLKIKWSFYRLNNVELQHVNGYWLQVFCLYKGVYNGIKYGQFNCYFIDICQIF